MSFIVLTITSIDDANYNVCILSL